MSLEKPNFPQSVEQKHREVAANFSNTLDVENKKVVTRIFANALHSQESSKA